MDEILYRFIVGCVVSIIIIVSMMLGYYLHHRELNKQVDKLTAKEFDNFVKMLYARREKKWSSMINFKQLLKSFVVSLMRLGIIIILFILSICGILIFKSIFGEIGFVLFFIIIFIIITTYDIYNELSGDKQ